MGKVNACLTKCFISLATLIGIISTLLLVLSIFGHGYSLKEDEDGELTVTFLLLYVLGVSTLCLSIFGVYGAGKEKQWALILFTAGMAIASLAIFVDMGMAFSTRNKALHDIREDHTLQIPLSETSDPVKAYFNKLQTTLKCCGIVNGYQDWGSDIPESCLCDEDGSIACVEAVEVPENNTSILYDIMEEHGTPMAVYAEPCLPILLARMTSVINVIISIAFGLASLWGVSVALSVTILCQLRKYVMLPPIMYSAQAKAEQYTTLSDTAEII